MKINEIKICDIPHEQEKMISKLLKRDIMNDILLDKYFVELTVDMTDKDDHPRDFLYRLLWETIYLRRENNRSTYEGSSIVTLRISLVEAINYIRTVTPPAYKSRIHELYKSLSDIKESLEVFLMDENNNGGYNIATFRKGTGFNMFETSTTYDFSRTEILRKSGLSGLVVDLECYNGSFGMIYDGKITDPIPMQCVISGFNKSHMWSLLSALKDELKDINILNIFRHDSLGTFVQLYIEKYSSKKFKPLEEMIRSSYKKLMEDQ